MSDWISLGYSLRRPFAESRLVEFMADSWVGGSCPQGPLSVDPFVWPEITGTGSPTWLGSEMPAWGAVEGPREKYRVESNVLISIDLLVDQFTEIILRCHGVDIPADRSVFDRQRGHVLGYEVCDPWFLSPLLRVSWPPEEGAALQSFISEHVDECLLFKNVEPAITFREICQVLVKEHGPFGCVRLCEHTDWVEGCTPAATSIIV